MLNCSWRVRLCTSWDFLSVSLYQLLPTFRLLHMYLDLFTMFNSDACVVINQSTTNMNDVKDDDVFEGLGLSYLMFGRVIEKHARTMEICPCHADIWKQHANRKRRLAALQQQHGDPSCVWQGRQLAWFISVGKPLLFDELRACISESLSKLLATVSVHLIDRIVATIDGIRKRLVVFLTDKLDWCDHCPYVAICAFYSTVDENIARARHLLNFAIVEFDSAMADGKGERIHRVAQRLFGPGAVRESATAWLGDQSNASLASHPPLCLALMDYA